MMNLACVSLSRITPPRQVKEIFDTVENEIKKEREKVEKRDEKVR